MTTMISTSVFADNVKFHVKVNEGTDSATVVTGTVSDSESDSVVVDEDDTASYPAPLSSSNWNQRNDNWNDDDLPAAIPLVAIIMGCGLPVFIVAIIMWFRYKNKQDKYRLAAQALAAGQEIPNSLFSEPSKDEQIFNKGVKNAFLGIGLGVFLWLLTGQEGLAAIGFLIFCMGLAQVVIGYSSRSKEQSPVSQLDKYKEELKRKKAAEKRNMEKEDDAEEDEKEKQPVDKASSLMDIIEAKDKEKE